MAAIPEIAAGISSTGPSSHAAREPHLLRFGLRRLFAFVSGAVALLGTMAVVGGSWAPAIGFFAALVGAHVLATLVGTRLRDSSRDVQSWRAGMPGATVDAPPRSGPVAEAEMAALADGPLARHEAAPRRSISAAVVGLIAGGSLGAAGIPFVAGSQTTAAGLALGAASCGVILAWLALLVANFWTTARGAWRESQVASGLVPAKRRRRPFWRRDDSAKGGRSSC